MWIRSMPSDPAALAAAEAALRESTIEIWTLFAVGFAATVVRTCARLHAVGLKGLRPDDYIVWVGIVLYAGQSALGYSVGKTAQGLANNSMTHDERVALPTNSQEYELRVIGSKIQIAGWAVYSALISSLKLSMLAFYIRLTEGLGWRYRVQIQIGFGLVIGTFIASIITIFAACRPFHRYWQINPDPGNVCQPAVSQAIVWVSYAANVLTDLYLIFIPLPMLWRSSLKTVKKIASSIVLGAGVFVLVCATLKSVFVVVDSVNGAQLAGAWGIREAFVAVMVTNLPMIFPLIRVLLTPLFGKLVASSQKKSSYKSPSGFRTIGGGGGGGSSSYGRNYNPHGPPSDATADLTRNGSEELIVDNNVKMQDMKSYATPTTVSDDSPGGIIISNSVEVMHEDLSNNHDGVKHAHEAC